MPLTFTFDEHQTGALTAVLKDDLGNAVGSGSILTFTLTLTNQTDNTLINSRFHQDVLNTNNVTLDTNGNIRWEIQKLDNIIVNPNVMAGSVERHVALFQWTWGTSKYSNEQFYLDITQIDQVGDVNSSIYGTILEADSYFVVRLETDAWDDANNVERVAALSEATNLIDNLYFLGDKTDSSQLKEFPRDGDTAVPDRIKWATFELAIKLLDGASVEHEMDALRSSGVSYEGVRESYHRGVIPAYLVAGIISARAWLYLKPYLRDPRFLKLVRSS